jgi:FAD binding domain-containing protein
VSRDGTRRGAWNLLADQRPAAVVCAEDTDDIAAAIYFARANELQVALQGTGHGARPGTAQGALLLRTERMRGIEVDAQGRTARVEAGVLAGDLGSATSPHGLSALPGTAPDVGVVGYTLGGGLGWLARRHGLACNKVRSIELVTADAEQHHVDPENEPDLFWALRGGGDCDQRPDRQDPRRTRTLGDQQSPPRFRRPPDRPRAALRPGHPRPAKRDRTPPRPGRADRRQPAASTRLSDPRRFLQEKVPIDSASVKTPDRCRNPVTRP